MRVTSDYEIEKTILRDISKIIEDYSIVASKRIKLDNADGKLKKEFLRDSTEKVCRFCKKSYPEVKFTKDAHCIPNFMGNNILFNKNECDTCNSLFSKYENEFANFMLPLHSMYGIKGKNGVPKYKLKNEPLIETYSENKIRIERVPNSVIKNKDLIDLNFKIPSYIPDYIYRCLIKIGLGIIPESETGNYANVFNWLIDTRQKLQPKQYMMMSIYPSNIKMDNIACIVMEKKTNCTKNYIDSILVVSYSNFVFQTYFPINSRIKKDMRLEVFPYSIPTSLDIVKKTFREYNPIDLNSKERIRNENFEFSIENMEK